MVGPDSEEKGRQSVWETERRGPAEVGLAAGSWKCPQVVTATIDAGQTGRSQCSQPVEIVKRGKLRPEKLEEICCWKMMERKSESHSMSIQLDRYGESGRSCVDELVAIYHNTLRSTSTGYACKGTRSRRVSSPQSTREGSTIHGWLRGGGAHSTPPMGKLKGGGGFN